MKEETKCSLYTSTKIYLYKYSITIAYQQFFFKYIYLYGKTNQLQKCQVNSERVPVTLIQKTKKAGAKQSDVACDEIVIVNHDEVGFK